MRVFIQSANGIPKSHNFYIAEQGFHEMGFETLLFQSMEDISSSDRYDLIVGGIGAVTGKLNEFGINPPNISYPEELKEYLGRKIWTATIDEVLYDQQLRPVFIKPIRKKRFSGTVLKEETDLPQLSFCDEDEPVLCSEVVDFKAEWRVFVRYGKVLDVRPYRGDWRQHYNPNVIEHAVRDYLSAPSGYAIDFGVTGNGETLMIEVNDGFSLGGYGLNALDYAKLLSARWCELVGILDECDTMYESYRWNNRHLKI